MSNNIIIKAGEIVVLKSGSPQLFLLDDIVELNKKVRCSYWNISEEEYKVISIHSLSLESWKDKLKREKYVQEHISELSNNVIRLPENSTPNTVLVIQFDSEMERQEFERAMFEKDLDPRIIN